AGDTAAQARLHKGPAQADAPRGREAEAGRDREEDRALHEGREDQDRQRDRRGRQERELIRQHEHDADEPRADQYSEFAPRVARSHAGLAAVGRARTTTPMNTASVSPPTSASQSTLSGQRS